NYYYVHYAVFRFLYLPAEKCRHRTRSKDCDQRIFISEYSTLHCHSIHVIAWIVYHGAIKGRLDVPAFFFYTLSKYKISTFAVGGRMNCCTAVPMKWIWGSQYKISHSLTDA